MSSTHELPARGMNPSPLPEAPPADVEHSTGHSMLVGAILAIIVVSALFMVGVIWYRAHGVREPTTAIFVNGDPTLAGTMVTISGMGRDPIIAKLSAANAFTVSALLEPGIYRVTARHGEQVLLLQDVEVKRFVGPRFNLSQSVKKGLADGSLTPLEPLEPDPIPRKTMSGGANDASRDRLVLVTEGSDAAPLAWLREQVRVVEIGVDDPQFDQHLSQAEGLLVRTYTRVNDALLDRAPKLRVVGRGGVGLENIDVAACRRRGINVVYTPDANTLAVGDFVFGYILQLIRPWAPFRETVYEPKEFKRIRNTVRGRQLNELTISILGMGRVGKRVGHIGANGFGMRVIYNDVLDIRPESLDFPAKPVDKDALYREADVLSIHVTMLPGNENLVGAAQIASLKQDAIVINTSRGEVLDVTALAGALRSGQLAGAALDVFHPEPPAADFPLLGMDNVILTPHLAARTFTALESMSWVVRDVVAVLDGQSPKGPAPGTPLVSA